MELQPSHSHAHEPPPASIRALHKRYSKVSAVDIAADSSLLDFSNLSKEHEQRLRVIRRISRRNLEQICQFFETGKEFENCDHGEDINLECSDDILVYEHELLPGLELIPNLLPTSTQRALLSRLWLRDLSNPSHNTNLNLHYELPYEDLNGESFFHLRNPEKHFLKPKDPQMHKPLSVVQMMNKKLRWMTLGGQYDWTRKVYPEMDPDADGKSAQLVSFPNDIALLIHSIFPSISPQAAIANLYTPGDQLSPHRDVSEASSAPLASISIGADAIFVIGLGEMDTEGDRNLVMRIRSGDVVLMGGESRWAWHSVPKVLASASVDPGIESWPGGADPDIGDPWREWMRNRRVNLNVRQMWD